ncbi:TonB-dependent siderophore receptor [Shinella curvata]|uniref:TonB-dependent siderophore receptor n=1 Tax=Shinella curvata TaxID=1817964 RepID=A0ABT8XBT9_9HYPH|nr:TonB-dependent siderophore receptor [Shinella curvata]MCJ8054878.1 TonB-dependent siderophore receptor [Shinella curvata]MDO6120726.1 TonB-dependent siderophore receptor [Shinella curvata]
MRLALACGTAAIALLAPMGAFAQDSGDATRLEEIRVEQGGETAKTGVEPVKGVVAKSTRSGSKSATALTEIPQSVTVVGREQMEMQSPQKIDEALRYAPGVNPSTYGTDSDTDWVFIRGFQADQSGVFLDGLSFYQTGFGTFLMDPFFLERIEVVKGPSSALYGGGNPGGFLNYVSKRPGERHRYIETGVNSFGNGYLAADIGDELQDGFSYRLNGKVSGGGWETDHSKDLRGAIAPSFKWQPDDATSFTVLGSLSRTDLVHTSTGFLPYEGAVVPNAAGYKVPRDFFYGDKDVEQYDRTQAMIGYEFSHTFDNDWTVRQNLRYGTVSLQEDGLYSNGVLTGTTLQRYRWAHDTNVNTFTVDNQLEGTFETGALEHTLLLGADYRWYRHGASTFFDASADAAWPGTTPSIDILNPVYGGAFGPPALGPESKTTLSQFGLYAQDQIRLGGWLATLNGRYDFVSRKLDTANIKRSDGEFSGRAGIAYEFANGLTPYLSYSTSFNPSPSDNGATVPSQRALMDSETGQQWEAGVKYAPTWFDGLFTAAVFDLTKQNVAVAAPDLANPWLKAALGEVNIKGIEFGAQANLDNGFKIIGGLTYLDAEVTEGGPTAAAGTTPVQIPDLTASLWLDYAVEAGSLEGLSGGVGVRYLGETFADTANKFVVPDATVVDAAIRYKKDNWSVALNVSNLFNKEYVASCQSVTSCGYGAGRTFMLKASTSW